MKMYKYAVFIVFFGIVSTNVLGGIKRYGDFTKDVEIGAENLLPRIYHPVTPIELESLKYYSPDSYCAIDSDLKAVSADEMKKIINLCFKQHEKWIRLSDTV